MREKTSLIILCLIFFGGLTLAQSGTIKGKITDKETGETLIGATVMIEGTTTGTITDFEGNYVIKNVEPGTYNLVCSFVSYETIVLPSVKVGADQVVVQDFNLGNSLTEINEVQVVAQKRQESEQVLLMDRKEASVAIESIGARELSTKGVSDAAAAATKITGITKQSGSSSLNVRGLGDRYNTTTLNGLPLPSNDSRFKNIDLELFGTDVISHISIEKAYSPWLYGDFGGANVDINTKKFTGKEFITISVGQSYNTSLFDADEFYVMDGPSLLGFQNEEFPNIAQFDGNKSYSFKNSWDLQEGNKSPNINLGISGGKSFNIGSSNSKLNTFFTLSFDNNKYYTDATRRTINASDALYIDINGPGYVYESQSTGMVNVNFSSLGHEIYFNSLFLNSGDQEIAEYVGFISEEAGENSFRRLSDFEQNLILVNQLLGKHKLSEKISLNWGVAYNNLSNTIPDRRQNTFQEYYEESETGVYSAEPTGTNYRYFHEYSDNEFAGNLNLHFGFGEEINNNKLKGNLRFGYSGRFKNRTFESHQFLHDIYKFRNPGDEIVGQRYNIDDFLNNDNFTANEFFVSDVVNGGFTYDGKVYINAFYASLEYNFSTKFLILLGSRLEQVYQFVDYVSNQGTGDESFNETKFLPSISMKYSPNDKSNIRLSGSRTYTLPQLREMPAIIFQDDVSMEFRGNPLVYPSTIYNSEIKYEYFPKAGELYSLAGFYKNIEDPMNNFVTGSSSAQYSIGNTGNWAYVYGLEAEIKKNIFSITSGARSNKLTGAANATLMGTEQELNGDKVLEETGKLRPQFNKKEEKLQGAAQLIGNLSLSHQFSWNDNKNRITSTVVYNYVSERIYTLGYSSIGNRIDQPVETLDFILKSKFNKLQVGLSVKNILDSEIYRVQENENTDWVIRSYYKGIKLGMSISYTF